MPDFFDEPPAIPDPEGYLPDVRNRARHISRRRRAMAASIALAVAAGAATVSVSALIGQSNGSTNRPQELAQPSPTPPVNPATAAPATHHPSSPRAAVSHYSTYSPIPTATQSATHPATIAPTHSTTPTTTAPTAPANCQSSDFAARVTSDASSYPQGKTVKFTLVVRNVSGHSCVQQPGSGCPPRVNVETSDGSLVWSSQPFGADTCPYRTGGATVAANWSETQTYSWNQHGQTGSSPCPNRDCGQVPPGTYQATGSDPSVADVWSPPITFQIT